MITADVIGSRAIEPRGTLRDALSSALDAFNRTWVAEIAVPFSVAAGDEVQGVVRPGPAAFAMVRRLRWATRSAPLRPSPRLRAGVGWGGVETGLDGRTSWELDGSAFHLARRALAEAAERRGEATRFAAPEPDHEAWANEMLSLLDAIVARWTPGQWQAVAAYERLGTYAAAARALGVALQNVQKRCAAARWTLVRDAEVFLGRSLVVAPGKG